MRSLQYMAYTIAFEQLTCFHCGDLCLNSHHRHEEKTFCCEGCKTVYELLSENELCTYYDLENASGIKIKAKRDHIHFLGINYH